MKKNRPIQIILDRIKKSRVFLELLQQVQKDKVVNLKGVKGSLKAFLLHQMFQETDLNLFIITSEKKLVEDFVNDFTNLSYAFSGKTYNSDTKEDIDYLVPITRPEKYRTISLENTYNNLSWITNPLDRISKLDRKIIISTPEIFKERIPSHFSFTDNYITLHKGQNLDYNQFCKDLLLSGFDKVDFVAKGGEISIRGGIIDIFPLGFSNPFRLEFWGNDMESIREFDVLSQRSIKNLDKVDFLGKNFHTENTELSSHIFEFIPKDTLIVLDEPDKLSLAEMGENGENGGEELFVDYKQLYLNPVSSSYSRHSIKIQSEYQPKFSSSIRKLVSAIQEKVELNNFILLAAEGEIHTTRFRELIEEFVEGESGDGNEKENELGIEGELTTNAEEALTQGVNLQFLQKIHWMSHSFSSGFISDELGICVFNENEVFDRLRFQKSSKERTSAQALKTLRELRVGDYVVHEDKGIAKFDGFKTVKIGGNDQDCIKLIFAEQDILYVNLNYIQKIDKYSSEDNFGVTLSKLGSSDWSKKKERTKKKLKDIARDLIKIYAERKMQKGFAFSADNIWQKEFEAAFTYEDTIDQAKATKEVKQDMESDTPMDRLVCGDVGFGKTEVAIRAAFKAVQSGKQVAVLVPTTVLAQQHYMTFRDRISSYPVNTDVLSRFRSVKEQNEILDNLESGKVDILIGTHRILSQDVKFKNLGLLVIDEEQRFGVSAKEKLRQMRSTVDTLTLTATPIPRTLNFSLMGARDMSVIETPPRNRLPVITEILEWEEDVVKEAIFTEVERGGQVFFVNDRIEDLPQIEMKLKMLLPRCKFATAHGQMKPKELEKIMQKFISNDVDVLITTKIVESGLDIPNANTIIINRAYNFGLAELYQLRGRVGRSNTQAYCYLLLEKNKKLNNTAIQRLQAIEEFTDLGSGFQLALKDMEIRGVGNLLGAEQSGQIYEVGFDMYQKILEEAVLELKEQEFKDVFKLEAKSILEKIKNKEVSIEIGSDALLPISYIKSDTERFEYYKKLYAISSNTELKQITEELEDKYGKLPREGNDLLFAIKLRIIAVNTGFEKVVVTHNKLICELPESRKNEYYKYIFPLLSDYISTIQNSRLYQKQNKLFWEVSLNDRNEATEILWKVKKTMELIDE